MDQRFIINRTLRAHDVIERFEVDTKIISQCLEIGFFAHMTRDGQHAFGADADHCRALPRGSNGCTGQQPLHAVEFGTEGWIKNVGVGRPFGRRDGR